MHTSTAFTHPATHHNPIILFGQDPIDPESPQVSWLPPTSSPKPSYTAVILEASAMSAMPVPDSEAYKAARRAVRTLKIQEILPSTRAPTYIMLQRPCICA